MKSKTQIQTGGAGKTIAAIIVGLALGLFTVAKRLVIGVFVLGLVLPMLPKQTVAWAISLPLVGHLAPVFDWLATHGLRLCLLVSLFFLWRLASQMQMLWMHQKKQSFALGGLLNYLEVSDYQFAPAIEVLRKPDLSFEEGFNHIFNTRMALRFAKWWQGNETAEFIAGTDPLDTHFKRGGEIATLRHDIEQFSRSPATLGIPNR